MKIRIRGNSVRMRLTRTEVDAFGRDGYLEERTELGLPGFIYGLQRRDELPALAADFKDGKLTMYVPASMACEWTTRDIVGYSHNFITGEGKTILLLLEKDFKCLDGEVAEDQSDNFENPLSACL